MLQNIKRNKQEVSLLNEIQQLSTEEMNRFLASELETDDLL